MTRAVRIGLMGPGGGDSEAEALAYEVGALVARRGGALICGGLGGAMEAASRGAAENGGTVIGILPGADPSAANPYVTFPIVTDMGNARNVINVLTAQAVIAVRGSTGTLSEIALALKCRRPVVLLQSWDLAAAGLTEPLLHVANTPAEAVEKAFSLSLES